MGVLNVTPDSFSDGGKFLDLEAAIACAIEMERVGADIIDIGGESTRPGSTPVSPEEEKERILPVLKKLRPRLKITISVDTRNAAVADAAARAGAEIINDISGLRHDPEMAVVVKKRRLGIVLMHMRGEPQNMQKGPFARNVMRDVAKGLCDALYRASQAGVSDSQTLLDPGIGFGKTYKQNFELLARLPELAKLGRPIVLGTSRKAFIGATLGGLEPDRRAWGTAATVALGIAGGAHVMRVHDVSEMVQVAKIADSIVAAEK